MKSDTHSDHCAFVCLSLSFKIIIKVHFMYTKDTTGAKRTALTHWLFSIFCCICFFKLILDLFVIANVFILEGKDLSLARTQSNTLNCDCTQKNKRCNFFFSTFWKTVIVFIDICKVIWNRGCFFKTYLWSVRDNHVFITRSIIKI